MQVFFIQLSFRMVFFLLLLLRKRLIHFLCMWLVTLMLFVPVGKRSKSRSQMFCKIENLFISLKMLLKILQYSQENICVLEFLFNQLYLKNAATQVFSCEYCKMFKYSFFYRTPAFHNVFRNSYVMIEFFGSLWVQNCYLSYFLCHCFFFLHDSSVRIGSALSFLIHLVFKSKLLVSVTFAHITTTAPSLF